MDFVEVCKDWLIFKPSATHGHLLSFPWLFPQNAVVVFFRTINFCTMLKSFEKALMTADLVGRMARYVQEPQRKLFDRLRISTNTFLVLEVRRDNLLRDAFNQLWRRQKRELFRPLKVRMGMDEGEEGFDLGGVQQEFFRLAIAEVLDPTYGLFTIDETTRMTWFLPNSKAPLHQYVLVGLLFGLAIYNGLTLSVTFPLALYRKLLEMPVEKLQHISDGWPELSKSLGEMLSFEGSVEDIFVREYAFSFESQGATYDIDMLKHRKRDLWPPQRASGAGEERHIGNALTSPEKADGSVLAEAPFALAGSQQEDMLCEREKNAADGEEATMVTNDNREQYTRDYISWLTDKTIAPQYAAFAAGFYLPVHKKSLQLFSPPALKSLVEGIQEIDIDGLQSATQYEDGYSAHHPAITSFWQTVQGFSLQERRQLLEFVTASERVPARGITDLTFIIQRNGVGDEVCYQTYGTAPMHGLTGAKRLPTSMTCFGRLLLPEYSNKEIMEQKLKLAIVNCRGFGSQ